MTTTADVKQKMDEALDRLIEQLEHGKSDALQHYLGVMSRFHRYSAGNQILIWVQNPEATLVGGFHTWLKVGRTVKKGEKGLAILAPRQGKRVERNRDTGEETEVSTTYFAPAFVFDISQTEGEELPKPNRVGGDPGLALARLEELVADMGIRLEKTEAMPYSQQGASSGGHIRLRGSLAPAHQFSVLCHELGHEMLHWSLPANERRDKQRVETEAEAVAFVVCDAIGLETNNAAPDYLLLYGGNKAILQDSLERIQKAAGRILDAVERAEKPERSVYVPRKRKAATTRKKKVTAKKAAKVAVAA